jgi:hypothetical protein
MVKRGMVCAMIMATLCQSQLSYAGLMGPSLLAKGTAITADTNGLAAFTKNPATLTDIDHPQIKTTYTNDYLSLVHNTNITWAQPLTDTVSIAINLPLRQITNIPEINADGIVTGSFNDYKVAPMITIGKRIGDLSIGTSFRYTINKVASERGTGHAVGIGVRYAFSHILSLGASIQQLFSQQTWSTGQKETIKPIYHVGMGVHLSIGDFLTDIDKETDPNNWNLNIGYSTRIHPMMAIHMGIKDLLEDRQYGFGTSLSVSKIMTIDYAYSQHSVLGQQHSMGITIAY